MSCLPINKPLVKSRTDFCRCSFYNSQMAPVSYTLYLHMFFSPIDTNTHTRPCTGASPWFLSSTRPVVCPASGTNTPWHFMPMKRRLISVKYDMWRPILCPQSLQPSSPSERRKMRENTPVMNSLKLPGFSLFIPRKRYRNIFIQVASTR